MAESFVEEYEQIVDTLEELYDNTSINELKQEILGFVDAFKMDFERQKIEYESDLVEEKDNEIRGLRAEYDRERL